VVLGVTNDIKTSTGHKCVQNQVSREIKCYTEQKATPHNDMVGATS